MANVVVISGHPDLEHSVANRTILEELKSSLPSVEIHKLDELYPDYKFDLDKEQQSLVKADLIIWQFPLYWYGIPALLKKYLEDVFAHGFAYGSNGTALKGKKLLLSVTAGAPLENYAPDGFFKHTIEEFLAPYEAASVLCGLNYLPPVCSGGMMYVPGVSSDEDLKALRQKAQEHAKRLCALIKSL
ncbi:MAG: NAD(P)H-dependent oxidoreductase [Succinivibrio sp.]|nr:NAD(P)H-dependent oxidoreductase [Succinivibrio sp.]